jgi:hypothetical protein
MKELSFGGAAFCLEAVERGGAWVASAEQVGNGVRFGIECRGASEGEAIDRLAAWLTWQHEHAAALAALQEAERDYHRTIAGSAFATPADAVSPIEMQKDGLDVVAAARLRLDEIRARRPE